MSISGDIDKFVVDLNTRLRLFKREFGIEATARMAAKTPVRSGLMQKSWGFTEKAMSIEIYNTAPYSAYVNNGTLLQAPQRIIERTLMETKEIVEIAKEKAGLNKK